MSVRIVLPFLAVVALAAIPVPAQELTLDEILARNQDALGGAESLGKIQSFKMTLKMVMRGGQMEAPMTIWAKRPNLVRSETTVQGRTIISAYDGTTGWMVNPFVGGGEPQKMDEKVTSNLAASDINGTVGSLAGFKAAGHTVELLGKEDVEGSPAYKLKLTLKTGMIVTYFLDAGTFLPIKSIAKISTMGQEMEVESFPGNYKRVGGVLFAHSMNGKVGGQPMMQMNCEKIELNEPIEDSFFKMPAAEKPAEKK